MGTGNIEMKPTGATYLDNALAFDPSGPKPPEFQHHVCASNFASQYQTQQFRRNARYAALGTQKALAAARASS